MSRISAPSAARRLACPIATGGSRYRPPSEKESGVTLSTPMTAGCFFANSRASIPSPASGEAENAWCVSLLAVPSAIWTVLGGANWSSLCAVAKGESSRRRRRAAQEVNGICGQSIANNGLQFLGVLDPTRDRPFFRQQAHQLASVGVAHFSEKIFRVAILQVGDRLDAAGAQQFRVLEADTFDAHAISRRDPLQNLFGVHPELFRDPQPLLGRSSHAQQTNGRADAFRLQHVGDVCADTANVRDGVSHRSIPAASFPFGQSVLEARAQENSLNEHELCLLVLPLDQEVGMIV